MLGSLWHGLKLRLTTQRRLPQKGDRVVVAMSGGVDSSVSAASSETTRIQRGRVLYEKLDSRDERGVCPSEQDWHDVQQVCDKLVIPCTQVDFGKRLLASSLPRHSGCLLVWPEHLSPDVLCNQHIKFGSLLNKIPQDAWLATGHYCRTDGYGRLLRGKEPAKDQSYYLSTVPWTALQRTIFPLGDIPSKQQVKQMAHDMGFTQIASKRESYGICFVGQHRKFADFLGQYIDQPRGQAVNLENDKVIGEHNGLFGYTIGQAAHIHHGTHKWFVADKDLATNRLICVPGSTHPALFHQGCIARDWTWIHTWRPTCPINVLAQVRYRQQPLKATLDQDQDGRYRVTFDEPIRAMAKGQQVVIWVKDWCLGSGVIDDIIPATSPNPLV